MITREDILEADRWSRANNDDVTGTVLNFMLDVSLRELGKIERDGPCSSCEYQGKQGLPYSGCTGCCKYGEYNNFTIKT